MSSSQSKRIYLWVAFTALMGVAYLSQLKYDTWRRYGEAKISVSYNVFIEPQPFSSELSKIVSFGARELLADIYWLQLIQYYGGGDPYGKYRKLPELFNTITDLSPKNLPVYQTGLLVLPGEGSIDQAIELGEKGQKNLPDSWEMPYYTGLVHHMYKKDYAKAGELFNLAASKSGAPANAQYFAAIYFNKANQRAISYQMFKTIYDTTRDNYIKERTAKYVLHLEGIFFLEDGIKAYSNRFGRLPSSLNELVSRRVIDQLPVSPLNLNYTYDPTTGTVGEAKP